MKRILKLSVALLFTFYFLLSTVQAQTPQKMTYQAVVRDTSNQLVTGAPVGIEINILQGTVTGTPVYNETQTPTTNANGLLTIEIGGQTGFDTINWANGSYFLETNIDPTGGSTYTITGVNQLLTVPYALHAKTAETLITDTSKHYIGELFGGGIIYWVTLDGQHGLIASLDDLDGGSGVAWSGNTNTEIGASAKNYYKGNGNTTAIIAQDATANKAATLCNSYAGDGFTDWYLPSIIELKEMDAAIMVIYDILANDGDATTNPLHPDGSLTHGVYWSSTEFYNTTAWYYTFDCGSSSCDTKGATYSVRAVRAF